MSIDLDFGEEIREYLHPALGFSVSVAVPNPLHQLQIADRMAAAKKTGDAIKAQEESLAEVVRGANGIIPKRNGQSFEPTPIDWAREFSTSRFDFTRLSPVVVEVDDEVARDPVSGFPLKEDQYAVWQDPETTRMYVVLWDKEKNEPIRRIQRVNFGNYLLERVLFNVKEAGADSGKGSPTPSVEQ